MRASQPPILSCSRVLLVGMLALGSFSVACQPSAPSAPAADAGEVLQCSSCHMADYRATTRPMHVGVRPTAVRRVPPRRQLVAVGAQSIRGH